MFSKEQFARARTLFAAMHGNAVANFLVKMIDEIDDHESQGFSSSTSLLFESDEELAFGRALASTSVNDEFAYNQTADLAHRALVAPHVSPPDERSIRLSTVALLHLIPPPTLSPNTSKAPARRRRIFLSPFLQARRSPLKAFLKARLYLTYPLPNSPLLTRAKK